MTTLQAVLLFLAVVALSAASVADTIAINRQRATMDTYASALNERLTKLEAQHPHNTP